MDQQHEHWFFVLAPEPCLQVLRLHTVPIIDNRVSGQSQLNKAAFSERTASSSIVFPQYDN